MKRSEMVEKLYEILKELLVTGKPINIEEVSDLLAILEDLGMEPPLAKIVQNEGTWAEEKVFMNLWESENVPDTNRITNPRRT